jgi:hypothetical protein
VTGELGRVSDGFAVFPRVLDIHEDRFAIRGLSDAGDFTIPGTDQKAP